MRRIRERMLLTRPRPISRTRWRVHPRPRINAPPTRLMRHRRLALCITLALLGPAVADTASAAAVTFDSAVMPTEVSFPGTREIAYRISLTGGIHAESVRIELAPPRWVYAGSRTGAPAYHVMTSVEGPGVFMPDARSGSPVPAQRMGLALPCGEERAVATTAGGTVQLAPAEHVTLLTTWRLSTQAPFASTDYRPHVTALARGTAAQTVPLPRPRILGPTGVPVQLLSPRAPAQVGRMTRIRGRTDPTLAGQAIALRMIGPVSYKRRPAVVARLDRFREVTRTRVDPLGHFEFRWRPPAAGHYGAYPRYSGRGDTVLPDRGCPVRIVAR